MKMQHSRNKGDSILKKYMSAELVREVTNISDDEIPEDHDMTESQEPPQMMISHKRKPGWARELIQDGEKYGALERTMRQIKKPKPFSS
jgi:hypothetical protein